MRVLERVERRVVAGLRPVLSTGVPIDRPLVVEAEGLVIRRSRSGIFAIEPETWARDAAGDEVMPPAQANRATVTLRDPALLLMPRSVALDWPTAPIHAPVDVELLPSPLEPASDRATVVRGRVVDAGTTTARGAVLIVATFLGDEVGATISAFEVPGDGRTTRWAGDFCLPLSGLAPVQWGSSPVDAVRVDTARLEVRTARWVDPGLPDVTRLRALLGPPFELPVRVGQRQTVTIEV